MEATHKVTKDGKELFRGTESECFGFVLKHQGQSVQYATRYGGYKITGYTPGPCPVCPR